MRYRDPKAAVDWLCNAFGFTPHMVADDGHGDVVHAQLTFGQCMIMVGPVGSDGYDALICQPDEAGGRVTQAPYIVISDPATHAEQAKTAGADILMGPMEEGGRGVMYTCRDPEGHIWNFGEYDPWKTAE